MGAALVLEVGAVGLDGTASHHGVADDECRALGLAVGGDEGVGDFGGIGSVDFDYVPVPCAILGGDILGVDSVDHG